MPATIVAILAIPLSFLILHFTILRLAERVLVHIAGAERVGGEPRAIIERRLDLAQTDLALKSERMRAVRDQVAAATPLDPQLS